MRGCARRGGKERTRCSEQLDPSRNAELDQRRCESEGSSHASDGDQVYHIDRRESQSLRTSPRDTCLSRNPSC